MLNFRVPGYPCAQNGPRQIDIEDLMADGRLQVDPSIFDGVPIDVLEHVLADFYRGQWGEVPIPQAKRTDYAEVGRYLLAAYEVGDAVLHVLTDHAHTLIELVCGSD